MSRYVETGLSGGRAAWRKLHRRLWCSSGSEVTTLLEDGEDDSMMVAASILSTAECRAWIEWGEATGFKLEKHAQTSPRVIFMHNKRPGVFKHHPPTYTTIHHHTPPYTTLYHAQRYVLMLFIWLTFAT
jgi:hypothetical protein